jgi:FAD/FMN-containing dehydrogenase
MAEAAVRCYLASMLEWSNWSGSLRFAPRSLEQPASEPQLQNLVRAAARDGRRVRVVGSGHSSWPLVRTTDLLISTAGLKGLLAADRKSLQATLYGGTCLHEAGIELHAQGLALENLGDVDTQSLAGALATGTHGSGRRLRNLSANLIGGRLLLATGEQRQVSAESDPELLRALRVSFGALGILSTVRLQLVESGRLKRREYCTELEDCLTHLDELAADHRNFDFYWYPRRDDVKIRTLNPEGADAVALPYARLIQEEVGFNHQVIARTRHLKFEEMEYFLPLAAGVDCFREVRKRILERHRKDVAWRVLYRFVAGDDAMLSPTAGEDSVTISIHHNAGLPCAHFFADIEPLFRAYGGRPHWGKRHSLAAEQLAPLYPAWEQFAALRRQLDPQGLFFSDDLRRLLGE